MSSIAQLEQEFVIASRQFIQHSFLDKVYKSGTIARSSRAEVQEAEFKMSFINPTRFLVCQPLFTEYVRNICKVFKKDHPAFDFDLASQFGQEKANDFPFDNVRFQEGETVHTPIRRVVDWEKNNGVLTLNPSIFSITIRFPEYQGEEIIEPIKEHGFYWDCGGREWHRPLSPKGIEACKSLGYIPRLWTFDEEENTPFARWLKGGIRESMVNGAKVQIVPSAEIVSIRAYDSYHGYDGELRDRLKKFHFQWDFTDEVWVRPLTINALKALKALGYLLPEWERIPKN